MIFFLSCSFCLTLISDRLWNVQSIKNLQNNIVFHLLLFSMQTTKPSVAKRSCFVKKNALPNNCRKTTTCWFVWVHTGRDVRQERMRRKPTACIVHTPEKKKINGLLPVMMAEIQQPSGLVYTLECTNEFNNNLLFVGLAESPMFQQNIVYYTRIQDCMGFVKNCWKNCGIRSIGTGFRQNSFFVT